MLLKPCSKLIHIFHIHFLIVYFLGYLIPRGLLAKLKHTFHMYLKCTRHSAHLILFSVITIRILYIELCVWVPINSIEQSPSWEAYSSSASQEIPHILWKPKVHYQVYKSPPLVCILSHINPGHFPYYTLKVHINIILPSMPRSTKCFSPSGFSTKTLYAPPHTCHRPCDLRISFFGFIDPNNIWWEITVRPDHLPLNKSSGDGNNIQFAHLIVLLCYEGLIFRHANCTHPV